MSERDITVLQDGQLAVATVEQTGTLITGASAIDTTCLVQTEHGVQNCVKTFPLNGGGGGGADLPDQTGHAGEFLSTDGTNPSWQAVSGGGTATITKWFDNVTGTTLDTGVTGASVSVYKNGQLLQPGVATTAKLFTGGSGKSISLAQTAPLSTANSWLFETELLWDNTTSGSTPCILCYTGTTDFQTPVIIYEVKMGWYLGSSGYTWDLDTANNSNMGLPDTGSLYKFRAEFTGTSYIFSYKKNGDDWQIARELNSGLKVYCSVPFLLLNSEANPSRCYNGSTLNMSRTKIVIDGQTWFDGDTAVEGTDYTNNSCTFTEAPSSTNDYHYDPTTGIITFSSNLFNENIAVEYGKSTDGGVTDYDELTSRPQINSVTLTGNKTASELGLLTPQTGLQNTATGSNSVTILGTPATSTYSVNIGLGSQATNDNSVAIGTSTRASGSIAIGAQANAGASSSVAIGKFAWSSQQKGISLGYSASCAGEESIQIGTGTNSTAKTFQVYTYQLLDGNTGLIPTDRMARIVELTTTSVELASDTIYNGAELASVTFTLPATVPANFTAQLNFTSGATATTFTAPATVTFEGNDCSNGVFTPLASKRYSVMVYSDGVNVIGLVMGN